jgi:hypothetical protein
MSLLSIGSVSLAQWELSGSQSCDIGNYHITTQSSQKIWQQYQAQLVQWPDSINTWTILSGWRASVGRSVSSTQWIISQGTGMLAAFNTNNAGTYQLNYLINNSGCETNVSTTIKVYEYVFAMISDPDSTTSSIQQHPNIGIIQYTPNEWNNNSSIRSWSATFDGLLVHMSNIVQAFEIIHQYSISWQSGSIIIGSNLDPRLLKRFVSQQSKGLSGTRIFVMNNDQFTTALLRLSLGQHDIMTGTILYPSVSQDDVTGWQFLDQLLLYGFPLELLAFALVSCIVIMIFVIIKHIIGFSIYQLIYPLLLGCMMSILWRQFVMIIIISSLISCRLIALGLKRLPVLYSAKIGLVMIWSILIAWCMMIIAQYLFPEYVSYEHLHQSLTIISIRIIIRATYRLFYDKLNQRSVFKDLWWFIIISIIASMCYTAQWLNSLLLSFPILVILAIGITILAGRYRGLQAREYIRFWPLIKHQLFKESPKS